MSGHVVLLGDSIFDNGAYVAGAPDVVRQLRAALPAGWSASLLAVDGAVTADVGRQLAAVPSDTTLLVISAGGNDALGVSHLLGRPAGTGADAVLTLAQAQAAFAGRYEAMVEAATGLGRPTALCTIYNANFSGDEGTIIRSALALFNDAITRAAFARGLPLIDLRLICSEAADYANPIEPSERGGSKIASAIARLALGVSAPASIVIAKEESP